MLTFDVEQVRELMRAFYRMSGIRFVLFDADYREIIAYPEENCAFCRLMKSCPQTRRKCHNADRRSFQKCEQSHAPVVYRCHAGLVEAAIPLFENEKIIGYLMFGQITDSTDKEKLYTAVNGLADRYGLSARELTDSIDRLTCKSAEEIDAAAKIMEACTSYIIYKELISPESSRIIEAAKAYIEAHLEEELDIAVLCRELGVGRTRLYELFDSEIKMGIAAYIRRRRMHRAKKLLKTTELSVAEIAEQVGFSDYNYFSRVYKKTYGKSPKRYRK